MNFYEHFMDFLNGLPAPIQYIIAGALVLLALCAYVFCPPYSKFMGGNDNQDHWDDDDYYEK